MILGARALLLGPQGWIEGGGVSLARGRITRVFRSSGELRRARSRARGPFLDLEGLVLTPGLVNAHAHLELSALGGRLSGEHGFVPWLRALVRERSHLSRAELEASVRQGARALLESGTTSVSDIDSTGACARVAARLGLRVVVCRELLDAWDPGRTAAALARVRAALPQRSLVTEGLAPHAPYTTSAELLRRSAALARARGLPLTIHWSETAEELQWLERGSGELARILPGSPGRRGLMLLEEARLLSPRTALVHGNHPLRGEPERLARAGVTLVHCPGTHAFFARAPFPAPRYSRAGVRIALGTDSLASNERLSMTREMALARETLRLQPAEVFTLATTNAARALGFGAELGQLRPGARADLAAWALDARTRADALDELTGAEPRAAGVWVAGRACLLPQALRGKVRAG